MTSSIKGYRIKDGKLVKNEKNMSVSERIRKRKSKKTMVVKPTVRT